MVDTVILVHYKLMRQKTNNKGERKIMIETLKAIGLVVFMQLLSLALEFIDTGTLKPSVRKRISVELIVLSVYVAGMTVFKGMISSELLTLIGTVYLTVVVSHLYKFLTNKKEEIDEGDKEEQYSSSVVVVYIV